MQTSPTGQEEECKGYRQYASVIEVGSLQKRIPTKHKICIVAMFMCHGEARSNASLVDNYTAWGGNANCCGGNFNITTFPCIGNQPWLIRSTF